MNKKCLITGSTGFIFSNFVRKAIREKLPYTFVSLDRVNGNANQMYMNKNHTFHIADITDQHTMDIIFQFERPDIVIHGAAESSVDYSLSNPNEFVKSNILGTQTIINSCLKNDVEKLIYISTDEVSGQLTNESDAPWKEDSILDPRNPYSASKAAGELMVKAAAAAHGLVYNITRSCNNYGPRQMADKLIPKVIKCIMDNEKIPIHGNGQQIREWIHVSDNCSAIFQIMNNGKPNEIYNISANQELPIIDVIQKICNAMGKGHDLITHIKDPRDSQDFRYALDSTKLRELGWSPSYKFKDGIVDTVEWYINNKWYLK